VAIGASSTSGPGWRPERLDELPTGSRPLAALYLGGRAPVPLVGAWHGRLLPGWAPQALVRRLPWEGKTFRRDCGVNRIAGLGERFPFHVRPGASALDGDPCLLLDYDRRENPSVVRRLFDELREVGPGLYLGPGLVRIGRRAVVWTWFALGS
jgi:hypothetical protein